MPFLLQTALLLGAGYALWRLWRLTDSNSPLLRYLIAGGFLIRAFAGQALFWISYLELPFGRSLQLGQGLWFFGLDALKYVSLATDAANGGFLSILTIPPSVPSVVFVQVLALFVWAFGGSVAIAILLNLTVYLGMSLLIARWAMRYDVPSKITAIPLFAIGYLPTWVLWALQPLKDAFFCFLIVLFAFAVDRFIAAWRRPVGMRAAQITAASALIVLSIYLLTGVRWYYAALALGTAGLVFLSLLFVRRSVGELALRFSVILLIGLISTQLFVISGGPYVPRPISATLQPWKQRNVTRANVGTVVRVVEESRDNLDRYQAGTTIKSGRRLEIEAPVAPKPVVKSPEPIQVAVKKDEPKKPVPPKPEPAKPQLPKQQLPKQQLPKPTVKVSTEPVKTTTLSTTTSTTTIAPAVSTKAPVPAPVPRRIEPVAPRNEVARSTALRDTHVFSEDAQKAELPRRPQERLLAGSAALLLPRSVAVRLELVSIGGGRGMMWFAELDTILFDLVLLAVIAVVIASLRRGAWRDPFVWYLLLITIGISGAIAYTISNYGTLVRHRGMLIATAVLLAIAARRCAVVKEREEEVAPILTAQSEIPSP